MYSTLLGGEQFKKMSYLKTILLMIIYYFTPVNVFEKLTLYLQWWRTFELFYIDWITNLNIDHDIMFTHIKVWVQSMEESVFLQIALKEMFYAIYFLKSLEHLK